MSDLERFLAQAARRLAKNARKPLHATSGDAWLLSLAAISAREFSTTFEYVARTEYNEIPIDFKRCDKHLADSLERAFVRVIAVFASFETFGLSAGWLDRAMSLFSEAAKLFAGSGRRALAAEVCRSGASFAARHGRYELRDGFVVRAEDYVTIESPFPQRIARSVLGVGASYGYAPWRVFGVAGIVVVLCTVGAHFSLRLSWLHATALAIGDYFTLGGAIEYSHLSVVGRLLVAGEALCALILNGFFITLLARRWFRA